MFKDVRFCVQPLSEYTPTFTVVIVPLNGTVWFALSNPRVVTVRSIPTATRAIIVPMPSFWNAMTCSSATLNLTS